MKDNDIIKILECCIKSKSNEDCKEMGCPLFDGDIDMCGTINSEMVIQVNALNLINRQQAENERLKTAYETLKQEYDSMFSANQNLMAEVERLKNDNFCLGNERDALSDVMDTAVSEAIKEFVERVYKTLTTKENWRAFKDAWLDNGECDWLKRKLFNLAKEMTEQNDFKE